MSDGKNEGNKKEVTLRTIREEISYQGGKISKAIRRQSDEAWIVLGLAAAVAFAVGAVTVENNGAMGVLSFSAVLMFVVAVAGARSLRRSGAQEKQAKEERMTDNEHEEKGEQKQLDVILERLDWIKKRMESDRKATTWFMLAIFILTVAYAFLTTGIAVGVEKGGAGSILVSIAGVVFVAGFWALGIWKKELNKDVGTYETKSRQQ